MSGIMIASEPLSQEMAGEILKVMGSITIQAQSAASFLKIVQSVERIANGTDVVSPLHHQSQPEFSGPDECGQ